MSQESLLIDGPIASRLDFVVVRYLPDENVTPDKGLVKSIYKDGVHVPVLLIEDGAGFIVADGRRRIKAMRMVGRESYAISARIYKPMANLKEFLTLIANEQRSPNVAGEMKAIEELIDKGYGERSIANQLCMPVSKVRKRLKLASGLIIDLKEALVEGKMLPSAAEAAIRLSGPTQMLIAKKIREKGKISTSEVLAFGKISKEQAMAIIPDDVFGKPEIEPKWPLTNDQGVMKDVGEIGHLVRQEVWRNNLMFLTDADGAEWVVRVDVRLEPKVEDETD